MHKLVLLRHGESQWNLENRFTGWHDVNLTEQGEREGREAGRLLKAEIASGMPVDQGGHRGNIVYIPRITLYPEEGAFPFEWCRRQFPVRPAFAMTINKAQGQTLARVGVDLTDACFTHGQLYVAASRVGNRKHLRLAVAPNDEGAFVTRNVVFREALTS